jgi:hypothetical protein
MWRRVGTGRFLCVSTDSYQLCTKEFSHSRSLRHGQEAVQIESQFLVTNNRTTTHTGVLCFSAEVDCDEL